MSTVDVPALLEEIESLKKTLEEQADDIQFLAALRAAGVDNWSGYEEAQNMVEEWNNEE